MNTTPSATGGIVYERRRNSSRQTVGARGMASKRDWRRITVQVSIETFERIKAAALKNHRSISAQCHHLIAGAIKESG